MSGLSVRMVWAVKPHSCDAGVDTSWCRACKAIRPGTKYLRAVVFPSRSNPAPFRVLRLCEIRAEGYSDLEIRDLADATTTRPGDVRGTDHTKETGDE